MEEKLEYIKEYHNKHGAFENALNIKITVLKKGYAETIMELAGQHKNSSGFTHGGAIFTLVDTAVGAAAFSSGMATVTASANISYLKPAEKGPIKAIAEEISDTRRLKTYLAKVYDGDDNLIASAQAVMYMKNKPYPPQEK